MYIFDLVLLVFVIAWFVGVIAFEIKKVEIPKGIVVFCIPIFLSVLHLIVFGLNYLVVPIYLASILILLTYIGRKKLWILILLSVFTVLFIAVPVGFSVVLDLQCYASMSYSQAFKELNKNLEQNYPFSNHKNIDYEAKYKEYKERFESADKHNSKEEYYIALKDYLLSFNDNHISMNNMMVVLLALSGTNKSQDDFVNDLKLKYVGSTYGFSIVMLDDKKAVVGVVDEECEAYKAGIRVGTIITKWNGLPVLEATKALESRWSFSFSADKDNMLFNQCMMLTRTQEGKEAQVTFLNDSDTEETVSFVAYPDYLKIAREMIVTFYHSNDKSETFESEILNGKHGYMKISTMDPLSHEETLADIKSAIADFKKDKVKNVIIDIRNNPGGYDEFGADIMGLFSQIDTFYLDESRYDAGTQKLVATRRILSRANDVGFEGEIVILMNSCTVSAGEGFAYNMNKLDNVLLAGITGTNGSFGSIDDGAILMPDNFLIIYPRIACIDEEGKVMIDADESKVGGVKPELKIPFDEAAVQELYLKGKDYELDYLINYLEK